MQRNLMYKFGGQKMRIDTQNGSYLKGLLHWLCRRVGWLTWSWFSCSNLGWICCASGWVLKPGKWDVWGWKMGHELLKKSQGFCMQKSLFLLLTSAIGFVEKRAGHTRFYYTTTCKFACFVSGCWVPPWGPLPSITSHKFKWGLICS